MGVSSVNPFLEVHMKVSWTRSRGRRLVAACVVAAAALGAGASSAMAGGAVYTVTNDPAGNIVQRFDRASDGSLSAAETFPTGGAGLGGLGGRQGVVALSQDEAYVYAVNAGSSTVSAFRVADGGLDLIGSVASGGSAPVSVAERAGRVYVLNSGGTPNVTAFATGADGTLTPLAGGSQPLADGASGAAQVSVAPDGSALVVSERTANRLETLPIDGDGRPGAPVVTPSNGAVPFGFGFGHRGDVIVSEAGASTVSSYRLGASGLAAITASLPVGQGAACWVAVTPNGKFAYTGNAAGSISGFGIGPAGRLMPLDADGLTAVPALSPRDLDAARNGRYLLAISPGNAAVGNGLVTSYRVAADGSLREVDREEAAVGVTGVAAS
jgi:6-phosphogluconolactonase